MAEPTRNRPTTNQQPETRKKATVCWTQTSYIAPLGVTVFVFYWARNGRRAKIKLYVERHLVCNSLFMNLNIHSNEDVFGMIVIFGTAGSSPPRFYFVTVLWGSSHFMNCAKEPNTKIMTFTSNKEMHSQTMAIPSCSTLW
jgi:hypothetical protein